MNGRSFASNTRFARPVACLLLSSSFFCIHANGFFLPFGTTHLHHTCRFFSIYQRNHDEDAEWPFLAAPAAAANGPAAPTTSNSRIFFRGAIQRRATWFPRRRTSTTVRKASPRSSYDNIHDDGDDFSNQLSDTLVRGLDLIPLLEGVARHSGTYRGREALLSLVGRDQKSLSFSSSSIWGQPNRGGGGSGIDGGGDVASSRRSRAEGLSIPAIARRTPSKGGSYARKSLAAIAPVASSAAAARQMYELVEAASSSLVSYQGETCTTALNLTFPPIYGADSSPWDTSQVEESSRDEEWLWLPADAWSLEHILQAEQTMKTLIKTKEWATSEGTTVAWMPGLAEIGSQIDAENRLSPILDECAGRVQIVQVRRATALPKSSSDSASYYLRLNADKYPILKLLLDKVDKLVQRGAKEWDKEFVELQMELDEVEGQIREGLAQSLLSVADVIDEGLDILARLDVIYAKAAFAQTSNGFIPQILNGGQIYVQNFVHPVLAIHDGGYSSTRDKQVKDKDSSSGVVPIDLFLSNENYHQRGLVISGPNGGGKTLSMKSFGLVCIMVKLGIPIPVARGSVRPKVGFVDDVLINVGDQQNVMRGESTWTSLLNSCSRMIQTVQTNPQKQYLALLDELGSGTDPDAGGAVAQAILEQFLAMSWCSVVATTHSPRLKTLSFGNDDYACATVLLEVDATAEENKFKRPTFRLEYGVIGESYALGAASRCNPPLDKTVIARAAKLMEEGSSSSVSRNGSAARGEYFQALLGSLEEQVQRREMERETAEREAHDARLCRQAMISLATAYELHLNRLNDRLEDCYRRLRDDPEKDELELIGNVLAEIKVTKKQVLSQKELLAQKGLKLLPSNYRLSVGESAVVLPGAGLVGGWDGKTVDVEVVADAFIDRSLRATEVLVQESSSSFMDWSIEDENDSRDASNGEESWIVQRRELAIWDYDSVWEEDGTGSYSTVGGISMQGTSIPDSKRRLNALLSTLKSSSNVRENSTASFIGDGGPQKLSKIKKSFASARARKAAGKTKKMR